MRLWVKRPAERRKRQFSPLLPWPEQLPDDLDYAPESREDINRITRKVNITLGLLV
jgi:hypothetical protein